MILSSPSVYPHFKHTLFFSGTTANCWEPQKHVIWNQRMRLRLALPLPSWVALGKSLCLSEPRLSHL